MQIVALENIGGKTGWSEHRGLVILAVGYQWFYNGANFLAFKVAGNALHPLMVATLRFSVAALILLPFVLARSRRFPVSAREFGGAALIGITMLFASQALAMWGTHFLPELSHLREHADRLRGLSGTQRPSLGDASQHLQLCRTSGRAMSVRFGAPRALDPGKTDFRRSCLDGRRADDRAPKARRTAAVDRRETAK